MAILIDKIAEQAERIRNLEVMLEGKKCSCAGDLIEELRDQSIAIFELDAGTRNGS